MPVIVIGKLRCGRLTCRQRKSAGEAVTSGVKDAVTPSGKPVRNQGDAFARMSFGSTVIVTVAVLPRMIVKFFCVAVSAKFPNGLTVRAIRW